MVGAGPAGRRGRLSLPYSPDMDDDLYSAAYLQHFVCGDTVADRHPSLCRNTARSVCCGGKGEGQDGCSNIGIGTVFVMRPHHLATGCFSKNMKETSPTGTVFGVKKIFTMTVSLNGHIKLWAPPQREAKGAFHLKKCHNFAKWYGIGWAIAQPVLSEQIFLCPIPCPVVNCRLKLGVVVNSLSFLGHFIILLKEPKFLTFVRHQFFRKQHYQCLILLAAALQQPKDKTLELTKKTLTIDSILRQLMQNCKLFGQMSASI